MPSPLLVPCDDPEALATALSCGADALVLDLGDADAPGDRAARRAAAADALRHLRPAAASPGPMVRVAALPSGLLDADLDAVMGGAPGAVLLPGLVGARDLQHLAAKLAVREAEHGLPAGRTRIIAMPADTAAGVLALGTLSGASPRLLALGWDPSPMAAMLGPGASPLRAARDLLLIAAAAAGVPAIDRGCRSDDLARACRAARRDGFAGRFARRPDEVATIAAAFDRATPRPRVDYARPRP